MHHYSLTRVRRRSLHSFAAALFPPAPCFFFFFNDTATTEIYTLSLHDALPIWAINGFLSAMVADEALISYDLSVTARSEEHTSELQSPCNLVCRLLLEKKKK